MSRFFSVTGTIFAVALLWLFVAGIILIGTWPWMPQTMAGWVAFVVFAPPLYVLAEVAGEWFWSSRAGRSISQHPSRAMRIFLGVLALGTAAVVTTGIIWLLMQR
jgi:hypothetical protein